MAEPTPIGDGLPVEALRKRLLDRGIDVDAVPDEGDVDDTPESVRRQVRALQAQKRRELFERAVPERFRGASYEDLHPDHQARAVVAGWLMSDAPTLFLAGPVGTGKTHAAYAVLVEALERGMWVYGATVLDLLDALRPDAAPSPVPRLAEQTDLFLFDDLAAERSTEWAVEQFGGIVDARTREGKRQIVTTNLAYAELEERLGRRIMSRLTGGSTAAVFTGRDLRRAMW